MVWTALGVAGLLCLVAAAFVAFGPAAALAVAGLALLFAAWDGRRPEAGER
jgi:hypothetical protein